MHLHVGLLFGLGVFANVLIIGFFWRTISMHLKDSPIGQAMAYLY